MIICVVCSCKIVGASANGRDLMGGTYTKVSPKRLSCGDRVPLQLGLPADAASLIPNFVVAGFGLRGVVCPFHWNCAQVQIPSL